MYANTKYFKEFLCSFFERCFSNRGKLKTITKILVVWLFLISSVLSGLPLSGGEAQNVYGDTPPGVAGNETNQDKEESEPQTDEDGASEEENKNVKKDEPQTESDKPSEEEDKDVEEELYQEDGVWLIGSATAFADFTNRVNDDEISMPANVKLTANINMEEKQWKTIKRFSGKFDGMGYTITVNADQYLFGACEGETEIFNLKVINRREGGGKGLIEKVSKDTEGNITVTITNCNFEGDVKGVYKVGGFIGGVSGGASSTVAVTMTNCVFKGNIICESNESGGYAGGFIGEVSKDTNVTVNVTVTITNCIFEGDVVCEYYAGGFIGGVSGVSSTTIIGKVTVTITGCNFIGDVKSKRCPGGFIGLVDQWLYVSVIVAMDNCSFAGNVICEGDNRGGCTGGFIGRVSGSRNGKVTVTITGCNFIGDVTSSIIGDIRGEHTTGGFIGSGDESVTINSCSFEGDVNGAYHTGGFIGGVMANVTMDNCSFKGNVNGAKKSNLGSFYTGGLIGKVSSYEKSITVTMKNCKYNSDQYCTQGDKESLIGLVEQGAEVKITPDKAGIPLGGDYSADSELGVEGEKYSIRHIYYTSKDGQLEIAHEDVLEGQAGDTIYPIEKEGFIYRADKEPDIRYDTGLGMKTLTMKYYDEGAKEIAEKLEADKLKAEKMKTIFIWGLAIVLIASVVGAIGYKIYSKKK